MPAAANREVDRSGLQFAPVTAGLCLVIVALTVLYGAHSTANVVVMAARGDLTPIKVHLGPWWMAPLKYLLSSFTCATPGELIFVGIVLLNGSSLERMMGSPQFAQLLLVFTALRAVVYVTLRVFAASLGALSPVSWIMPGALWIALAMYVYRRCLSPTKLRYSLFGLELNQACVVDVLVLQAVIAKSFQLEDFSGLLCGLLVSHSALALHKRKLLPQRCTALLPEAPKTTEFFGFPRATASSGTTGTRPATAGATTGGADGGRNTAATLEALRQALPREDLVREMEGMGFDAPRSRAALLRHRNDINAAVADLVGTV